MQDIAALLTCHYRQAKMPAKRRDPEVAAFMREVMDVIGVDTASELATLLIREELLEAKHLRKVHRWITGENSPDHAATLMLLRRAGFLCNGTRRN